MNAATIIEDLKQMIGPGCEVDDTGLLRWVNDAYLTICDEISKEVPDYFVKTSTTSTVADQQEYVLPTDFDKAIMVNIAYDGSSWQRAYPLQNIGIVPVHARGTSSSNGFSEGDPAYYLFGEVIGFAPIPSENQTDNIKMWYTYVPDELTSSDTPAIPTKYQHIIKYGAYANYLDLDDEHVAAERMRKNFDLKVFNMIEQLSQRQVDAPKSVVINTNIDLYYGDEAAWS